MVALQELGGLNEQLVIDSSEGQPSYLLITGRGRYIKLSSHAYHLLRNVHSGVSFEALAERLSKQQSRTVQPAEVEAAYQHVAQNITAIENKAQRNATGFWFRISLLPAAVVERISRYLSIAFHPIVALVLLIGIVATVVLRWSDISRPIFPSDLRLVSSLTLFLISMIFHELGHASACVRYGLKPSEIGFAIYWIYPVFYSNVNAVWRLKRWQRMIVDLGGVYFQFIIGALYLIIYGATAWEPMSLAIAAILYSCLFTLNPILKFDGYWFIADMLGVINLWKQPGRILHHAYARLRKWPVVALPWPRWITIFMGIYSIASISFWIYFTWRIGAVIWGIGQHYSFLINWAFLSAVNPPHSLAPLAFMTLPTLTLVTALLTLFYIVKMVVSAVRSLFQWRLRPPGEQRPLTVPQK